MRQPIVKEEITTALMTLLKQKPYREIKVTDVVKKAGVCRASFYRNYLTMDEVIDEAVSGLFSGVFQDISMSPDNVAEYVEQVFRGIRKHREDLEVLIKQGLFYKVADKIYQETIAQIENLDVFNNRYQPYFFAGASAALIYAWIDGGFAESERQMVDIFMQSLHGYMPI